MLSTHDNPAIMASAEAGESQLSCAEPNVRPEGLPGPRAAALIERDQRVMSPSYTRDYPLVVERASGAMVKDVDGNIFLDCTAGIAVTATGHCHPVVVERVKQQASAFLHMAGTDFYYEQQTRLAERIAAIAPISGSRRVCFANSGTEAIEASLKLARYATGRHTFIAFYGAFHGRTMGALSLTASKPVQRKGFAMVMPGVHHVPYADCYRCPKQLRPETCEAECLDSIEHELFAHLMDPEDVAAIVVEPIQGEGGCRVPPDQFLQRLRDITERHGVLLVVDEVQTGVGRTGKMFGIEHANVKADVIAMAKGLASGLPIGAAVARADLMVWPPGAHASTFAGNPIACAAADATLALVQETLANNAAQVGAYLRDGLMDLAKKQPLIGDVRGRGLMLGIELVRDRVSKERAIDERNAVVQAAFRRGLLLLGAGRSVIRLSPPLVFTRRHADVALRILDQALSEVSG